MRRWPTNRPSSTPTSVNSPPTRSGSVSSAGGSGSRRPSTRCPLYDRHIYVGLVLATTRVRRWDHEAVGHRLTLRWPGFDDSGGAGGVPGLRVVRGHGTLWPGAPA